MVTGENHLYVTCHVLSPECGFRVHQKCRGSVLRECAGVRAVKEPEFEMRICPEAGLSAQENRCAECQTRILPRE